GTRDHVARWADGRGDALHPHEGAGYYRCDRWIHPRNLLHMGTPGRWRDGERCCEPGAAGTVGYASAQGEVEQGEVARAQSSLSGAHMISLKRSFHSLGLLVFIAIAFTSLVFAQP